MRSCCIFWRNETSLNDRKGLYAFAAADKTRAFLSRTKPTVFDHPFVIIGYCPRRPAALRTFLPVEPSIDNPSRSRHDRRRGRGSGHSLHDAAVTAVGTKPRPRAQTNTVLRDKHRSNPIKNFPVGGNIVGCQSDKDPSPWFIIAAVWIKVSIFG